MDLNTRKERFSLAYINAVATYADCEVIEPKVDRRSVDGILKRATISETIGFQAKATSQDFLSRDGHAVHFPLPIRDYDNLRVEKHPFILIVVLLPDEETEWLTQTDDKLCLRRCGYWLSLTGHNPVPNRNGVTVRIPMTNVFSSAQLTDMMDKVATGETL
jgi:hypothetical protein